LLGSAASDLEDHRKEETMRYILNSAVITNWGTWSYEPLTVDEATEWLRQMDHVPTISTVRYKETVQAIKELTGVDIPINDQVITMQPGDEALVFRLRFEMGATRIAKELKGRLTPDFVKRYIEIGLLKHLGGNDEVRP